MTKLSDYFNKKLSEMTKEPLLQLLIVKTADGVTYEFFGAPITNPEVSGISLGPLLPLEEVLDYLEQGVEEYLGSDGDHGPRTMN